MHGVGPDRPDYYHRIAGIENRLVGQHDAMHAGGRRRDALDRHRAPVKPAHIFGDRLAQFRHAVVGHIESLVFAQSLHRRLLDEFRRRLVALAEPQRNHALHPLAHLHDLANLAFGQLGDALVDFCGHAAGVPFCGRVRRGLNEFGGSDISAPTGPGAILLPIGALQLHSAPTKRQAGFDVMKYFRFLRRETGLR